jgi:hypothetical protein
MYYLHPFLRIVYISICFSFNKSLTLYICKFYLAVFKISFKYYLLFSLVFVSFCVFSQQTVQSNQSVITLIGDIPPVNQTASEPNAPLLQQTLTTQNKNIEPTLENGFHMRFELYAEEQDLDSLGYDDALRMTFFGKPQGRKVTMSERRFNIKKRVKHWLPERRRKYRPHLCGRF